VALSGCGTGGIAAAQGDETHGAKLFKSKCAGCHTLSAAGSKATIGPNLDEAFRYDRKQGFEDTTIRQVVYDQIAEASAPMPKDLVSGHDRDDVAAFVAAYAGTGKTLPGQGAAGGGGGTDGKSIFTANCSSCHTLKDAGSSGTVGPNLDQLKPDLARVQQQVIHGGGAMPAFKGQLTDAQIKAVAKYVSSVAGKK
jgi:cbb3-type cytochrome c oxidase subunit III